MPIALNLGTWRCGADTSISRLNRSKMEIRHKILLVDICGWFRGLLKPSKCCLADGNPKRLPGARPRCHAGVREAYSYITDLRNARMDGLQLNRHYAAVVELRTVVLTTRCRMNYSRSRVYALGVDLYWRKLNSESEMKAISSILDAGTRVRAGFLAMQTKPHVDLVMKLYFPSSSNVSTGPFLALHLGQ